jgi:hypothetical protein
MVIAVASSAAMGILYLAGTNEWCVIEESWTRIPALNNPATPRTLRLITAVTTAGLSWTTAKVAR